MDHIDDELLPRQTVRRTLEVEDVNGDEDENVTKKYRTLMNEYEILDLHLVRISMRMMKAIMEMTIVNLAINEKRHVYHGEIKLCRTL